MPWPLLVLGYVAIVASSSDTTLEYGFETSLEVPYRSFVTSPLKYYAALVENRNIGPLEINIRDYTDKLACSLLHPITHNYFKILGILTDVYIKPFSHLGNC
uniref:Uncharacterized protein n=1 Tax=Rhodnius prolixus TaxID=13249 RepID=T1HGL9_RHOPR